MISLDKIPVPVAGVVGRVLENKEPGKTEAVIVLPDKGQVKVLNEVGTRIWSLIDGKRSVSDIIRMIVQEYQVSQKDAENDTLEFLAALNEKGVIDFSK
jgi:coenzyme PQQ biosynthesis protein PqqD